MAAGMRKETEEALKQRFAAVLGKEGLVTREEFDAVKAMAAKARVENDALEARIAKLEGAASKPAQTKAETKAGPKPSQGARAKKPAPPKGGKGSD